MQVPLTPQAKALLRQVAALTKVRPSELAAAWIEERLAEAEARFEDLVVKVSSASVPVPLPQIPATGPSRCFVPKCGDYARVRGLCSAHYQKVAYYLRKGSLTEGWLLRQGKILPREGYSIPPAFGGREGLSSLPSLLPNDREDTRWLFGAPEAQLERLRLEDEARKAGEGAPS